MSSFWDITSCNIVFLFCVCVSPTEDILSHKMVDLSILSFFLLRLLCLIGENGGLRGADGSAIESTMYRVLLKCSNVFHFKSLMFHNVPFVPGFKNTHTRGKKFVCLWITLCSCVQLRIKIHTITKNITTTKEIQKFSPGVLNSESRNKWNNVEHQQLATEHDGTFQENPEHALILREFCRSPLLCRNWLT